MTHCPQHEALASIRPAAPLIALAGQPNVGKSTVFNHLTGMNQHVGNWPGKTVEQKSGVIEYAGQAYTLIDLPGTYSLTANSEEERIARDFILRERPTTVIAVVDAAILERSLYLLAELLLLPAPVILALNMMDVAAQEGLTIQTDALAAALGLPVVPMCATQGRGYTELLAALDGLLCGAIPYQPHRPLILPDHQAQLDELTALIGDATPSFYPPEWAALKLLEGDEELRALMQAALPEARWRAVHDLLLAHEDAILDIAGARYEWIARMINAAVSQPRLGQMGLTARLDRVLTHPLAGSGVLLAILGAVFGLTYAVGAPLQGWLDSGVQALAEWSRAALAGGPPWFAAMVADGAIGGVGMVVTFLPILVIFFAALGLLEDTGYMARAAYLMDRWMHMMGLHGKSFIPLLLGFGCNVPAVLGARIIETRRARLLTALLAPLVPCTARMAVITVLAPLFFGVAAGWVAWGLVALNLLLLAASGWVFHRFILRGEPVAFIMELPLYHRPNLRTVALYVWQDLVAFLRKAGSVILVASLIVWALAYFPGAGAVEQSYLARIGQALAPLGRWLGVPWPFMVALLTSFVAKENTIATLGVLYGDLQMLPTLISPWAALGFLVVQMLFIPCAATVAALKQETGWRWTALTLAGLLVISLALGGIVYQVGNAWGG